jgi:hypothetical protein
VRRKLTRVHAVYFKEGGAAEERFVTPKPIAIGLLLCDRVIVDKDTNSPSAIGIFTGLAVEYFPSDPQRFSVLAVLTDTQGNGRGKLTVYRLDENWL